MELRIKFLPTERDFSQRFFIAFLLFALALLPSCSPKKEVKPGITVTDAIGHDVSVPIRPEKIISLAPNITEILFAIGAGDQIAGVTDFCTFPDAAKSKPKTGGLTNPNLEAMLQLQPDLILVTADGNPKAISDRAKSAGIPVFTINPSSWDQILATIQLLGKLTGHEIQADSVVNSMTEKAENLTILPVKPSIFVLLNEKPLISAAKGSFLDDILEKAGGFNVVPSGPERYPVINQEGLLKMNPDVILWPSEVDPDPELFKGPFKNLKAVKSGKVFKVNPDLYLRPGPRVADAVADLNSRLQP
ncbi:MAG: helical backbone metal receptor [Bacteroidetes bacterium]|nr:helical backbone metal receptor [Bacteroidota bacterium]